MFMHVDIPVFVVLDEGKKPCHVATTADVAREWINDNMLELYGTAVDWIGEGEVPASADAFSVNYLTDDNVKCHYTVWKV